MARVMVPQGFGTFVKETYGGVVVALHNGSQVLVKPDEVHKAEHYDSSTRDADPQFFDATAALLLRAEREAGRTTGIRFTWSVLRTTPRDDSKIVFYATLNGNLDVDKLEGRPFYDTADEAAHCSTQFYGDYLVISAVGFDPIAVYGVRLLRCPFEEFRAIPAVSVAVAGSLWSGHTTVLGCAPIEESLQPNTSAVALRRWHSMVYTAYLDGVWGHPDAHLALCCNALVAAFRHNKMEVAAELLVMFPTMLRGLAAEEHWVYDLSVVMHNMSPDFGELCHNVPSLSVFLSLLYCKTEFLLDKVKEKVFVRALINEVILRAAKNALKRGFTVADVVKAGNYNLLQAVADTFYWLEEKCDCTFLDVLTCWRVATASNADLDAETLTLFTSFGDAGCKAVVASFTQEIYGHRNFNYFYMFKFVFALKNRAYAPDDMALAKMHEMMKTM